MLQDPFRHDLRGTEFFAAVNQINLRRKARQEQRLLHGGIAPSHHRHRHILVKRAIAGGASGNPSSNQLLLGLDAQILGGGPRGHNQRGRLQNLAIVQHDLHGAPAEIHVHSQPRDKPCAKARRLLFHALHQLKPRNRLRKSGVILDVRGRRQLPAGLMALDHHGAEIGPRRIDRRRIARGATSQNHHFLHEDSCVNE